MAHGELKWVVVESLHEMSCGFGLMRNELYVKMALICNECAYFIDYISIVSEWYTRFCVL